MQLILNSTWPHVITYTNNKMSIHQSGNKQHHSTKSLGLLFTSHPLSAVDEKRVTGILMLDQSKTFDSAQHKILLANLNTLDVSPEALSWLESYHTDRQQFVQINSSRSNLLTVSRGVTQGSVLGPSYLICTQTICSV